MSARPLIQKDLIVFMIATAPLAPSATIFMISLYALRPLILDNPAPLAFPWPRRSSSADMGATALIVNVWLCFHLQMGTQGSSRRMFLRLLQIFCVDLLGRRFGMGILPVWMHLIMKTKQIFWSGTRNQRNVWLMILMIMGNLLQGQRQLSVGIIKRVIIIVLGSLEIIKSIKRFSTTMN